MSTTYTTTVNLQNLSAAGADSALADLVRVIDAHMIVTAASQSLAGTFTNIRQVTVTYVAASDVEAASITREAVAALPAHVAHDALRILSLIHI